MLTYLKIKNFAIIDEIEIELNDAMTVVTGETGAGKSLLVDTLGLALGNRADNSMIKNGTERCEITAIFDLTKLHSAQQWLNNNDLTVDNNNHECIIQRIFTKDGRSRNSINGMVCTLQTVKELGNLLIDIHGQHEHHSLLKHDTQRNLLDDYANNADLIKQIKTLYLNWQQNKEELTLLEKLATDSNERIDLLNYQLQEFNNLAFNPEELNELKQEHNLLNNAEEIITNCQNVCTIAIDDENNNILSMLANTQNILEKLQNKDEKITNICQLWENTRINLEEGINELRHYLEHIELNQERLQWLETRLQNIYSLARKHKVTPEELPQIQTSLATQLQNLTTIDSKLQQLITKTAALENQYNILAKQVTQTRSQAAKKLSTIMTQSMGQLGMNDGQFAVKLIPSKHNQPSPHGNEQIEFTVSANIGHSLQPLAKIASGGELSRISLALQVILTNDTTTPTLVFDEVDVGIGGKTAEIVGKLLRQLGKHKQIICITHLPQVASYGNNHIKIEKLTSEKSTQIKLTTLDEQGKTQEIARMLGGINITKRTLAHAQEMLQAATT